MSSRQQFDDRIARLESSLKSRPMSWNMMGYAGIIAGAVVVSVVVGLALYYGLPDRYVQEGQVIDWVSLLRDSLLGGALAALVGYLGFYLYKQYRA